MHNKRKKRSVAIQSTEFFSPEYKNIKQTTRLSKKPGFRNLLQKSVAIVSQESTDDVVENLRLPGEPNSKSVQAGISSSRCFQRSVDLPRKHSYGTREVESRSPNSGLVNVIERGAGTSKPGTSRMTSETYSSMSVVSVMNEAHYKGEGSLAVIYGEKVRDNSISSSYPFFYGSQGSRRLSDETVLLIEDYQSYDHTNTARRLNTGRNLIRCCKRSARHSVEMLTRPLPLLPTESFESKEEIVCRICHEGDEIEPLIQPCLCKGSIGSVHANCLKIWLEQSNTSRCELCNYPYAIRQTKKYPKCLSVRVFYKTVIDRRAMAYDVISFVVITPLTLVGVVMCLQASLYSAGSASGESSFRMGYITKVGMIMLSVTILIAYAVWLYTLISYHYRAWKKWYNSSYDVEVIPVRMTSEERFEAARRLSEEMRSRHLSSEQAAALVTVLQSPHNQSFYRRSLPVATVHGIPQFERLSRQCSAEDEILHKFSKTDKKPRGKVGKVRKVKSPLKLPLNQRYNNSSKPCWPRASFCTAEET